MIWVFLEEECLPLERWWWSLLFFLDWTVRAWSSLTIFSSQASIQAYYCDQSSHSLLNLTNLFLAQIPWMKEPHVLGRPFKLVITISAFSTSSSTSSSCSLNWETLVKYDCKVSAFYIFTFFNWFLKVIFFLMFFPSKIFVKSSYTSFSVLN